MAAQGGQEDSPHVYAQFSATPSNVHNAQNPEMFVPGTQKQKISEDQENEDSFFKKLNEDNWIFGLYGWFDATMLFISLEKAGALVKFGAENSKYAKEVLHDWLRTPQGIGYSLLGIIPLSTLSTIANSYSTSKVDSEKNFYRNWQMGRDGVKAGRNMLNIWKAFGATLNTYFGLNYYSVVVPFGLTFGVISLTNRVLNRMAVNDRKDRQDANKALIKEIEAFGLLKVVEDLPEDETQLKKHAHRVLFIPGKTSPDAFELYFVDHNGKTHLIDVTDKDAFLAHFHIQELKADNEFKLSLLNWRLLLDDNTMDQHFETFCGYAKDTIEENQHGDTAHFLLDASAIINGLASGLYSFGPILTAVTLSPEIFLLVAAVSVFFATASVLTNYHEEKLYQKDLIISQQKAELALASKELERLLKDYLHLGTIAAEKRQKIEVCESQLKILPKDKKLIIKIERLKAERIEANRQQAVMENKDPDNLGKLTIQTNKVLDLRDKLHDTYTLTDSDKLLIGLRHGVSAYTALVCSVFAISMASLFFFATPLPELVIACVAVLGVALLAGFMMHAWNRSTDHQNEIDKAQKNRRRDLDQRIQSEKNISVDLDFKLSSEESSASESPSIYLEMLGEAIFVLYLLNWLEALRSLWSGWMKGFKLLSYTLDFFAGDEPDQDQAENPLIWIALAVSAVAIAVFCALTYAGRTLAKKHDELYDNVFSAEDNKNTASASASETESETESVASSDGKESIPEMVGDETENVTQKQFNGFHTGDMSMFSQPKEKNSAPESKQPDEAPFEKRDRASTLSDLEMLQLSSFNLSSPGHA